MRPITIAAYLSDPRKWRRFSRLATARLLGRETCLNATADTARQWCMAQSVPLEHALNRLQIPFRDLLSEHADCFVESETRVAECPQSMGGGGNVSLLYSLAAGADCNRVLETGVAYGWSSLAILLALQEKPEGQLISTNLHYQEHQGDERFVGCAVPDTLRNRWTIIREPDVTGIPKALNLITQCDLVHYDSAKSYEARMQSYPLLWNALRVGGLFVSDDIDDNVGFQHFCVMVKQKPVIVATPQPAGKPTKYVGILCKHYGRPPRQIWF